MKFISKNENYLSPKGKGWFKNPYVVPAMITDQASKQTAEVMFNLCVTENGRERVLDSFTLNFTEFNIDALIEVEIDTEGEITIDTIDLIDYLNLGGAYDPLKVVKWGQPSYGDLSAYFTADFAPIEFKDTPMKFLAVDWALNSIMVEGMLLKEYFELEA